MDDDLRIIRRVLEGDTEPFRWLVTKYQQALLSAVRGFLWDAVECEDLVQDVFVAAYSNLARYDCRRAAFSTWLYTIARRRCLNRLRQKQPRGEGPPGEPLDTQTPFEVASRKEVFERLDAALDALPVEQKTAFVLCEIRGLSYQDIAMIENTSLSTVKSRIHRANALLCGVCVLGGYENNVQRIRCDDPKKLDIGIR
jgi:RNA polymerase sigma-70 factor (ECF subfamily)